MEMKRLSRESYYLLMARMASLRATCTRARHGCVLVNKQSNRVISIGYNGTPPGKDHCADVGCLLVEGHCVRTIHAEIQAIASARTRGVYEEIIAYTTGTPCINCYKALVAINVKEIHCSELYTDLNRDILVKFYGVPIHRHRLDPEKLKAFFIEQLGNKGGRRQKIH